LCNVYIILLNIPLKLLKQLKDIFATRGERREPGTGSTIAARSEAIGSFGGGGRRGRQMATSTMEAVMTGGWHSGGGQRATAEWSGTVDRCGRGGARAMR